MAKNRLGERLIAQSLITREQLDAALSAQHDSHRRLGALLMERGNLSDEGLRNELAKQWNCDAIDLGAHTIDDALAGVLPVELIQRWEVAPIAAEGHLLHVAMTTPGNRLLRNEISQTSGYAHLKVSVVTSSGFATWLQANHNVDSIMDYTVRMGDIAPVALINHRDDPPEHNVVVSAILRFAFSQMLERNANMMYVEPLEGASRVRLRVAGQMHTLLTLPQRFHASVIDTLRSCALMTSNECQRGLLEIGKEDGSAHFRLDLVTTLHGESAALREVRKLNANLKELGFSEAQMERIDEALANDGGLVLVAGPRASGRTTTLHAIAQHLSKADRLTMAVGHTTESAGAGVLTVAVRDNQTLAQAVRATLHHNPDVLIVDGADSPSALLETVNAAMAGHQVIVSVPAFRAVDAVTHSAVPRYLLASTARCVIAQCLLRQLCMECAIGFDANAETLAEFGITETHAQQATFKRGKGCSACLGSGYAGLVMVREVLFVSTAMQSLMRDDASVDDILQLARSDGFTTLWEEAVLTVMRGLTTFDEVRAALTPPTSF